MKNGLLKEGMEIFFWLTIVVWDLIMILKDVGHLFFYHSMLYMVIRGCLSCGSWVETY